MLPDVSGFPVLYRCLFYKFSFINCLCFDQSPLVLIKTFFRNLKIQNFCEKKDPTFSIQHIYTTPERPLTSSLKINTGNIKIIKIIIGSKIFTSKNKLLILILIIVRNIEAT